MIAAAGSLARGAKRFAAACEHVSVALLSRPELVAASARAWETFNRTPLARGEQLFDWERELVARALPTAGRVLVVGCGAGREILALQRDGHRVDGLDIAPEAVERARQRVAAAGRESTLLVAAIEDAPSLPGPYDLVLFSWFCYSYIPDRRFRVKALRAASGLLAPGGHVVLSYIPERKPGTYRAVRVARGVARLAGSGWEPEPGDTLAHEPTAGLATYQRVFRPEWIAAELADAGLRPGRHDVADGAGLVVAAPRVEV